MAQLQATGLTRALTCRSIPPLALSRSAECGSRPPRGLLLIIWSRGAAVGDLVSPWTTCGEAYDSTGQR